MQLVIQRVLEASVTIQDAVAARIGPGLLVFAGFVPSDSAEAFPTVAKELVGLRIFDDAAGRMGRSLTEIGGEVLVVPEVTLAAALKGSRPSFDAAAAPEAARMLFQDFVNAVRAIHPKLHTGVFQAHMAVRLTNDGPVTFVLTR